MNTSIITRLANCDHAYYPIRLISSTFFVPYWSTLTPIDLPEEQIDQVVDAARLCVEISMKGERIYWNISFEEHIAIKVWREFDRAISSLPKDSINSIYRLCSQVAISKTEIDSADFFINMICRLRLDKEFRHSVGYADNDANLLDAAYEQQESGTIDIMDLRDAWLHSTDTWDKTLRSQTPDLPESIWVIFTGAYEATSNTPRVQDNIRSLIESEAEYRLFVGRLEGAFQRCVPDDSCIAFPDFPSYA